ncbi:hypothetical protein FRB99_007174 [Tulasnella sp. 403]|nr:hypothetical protein FRB99_007174 [Tulasnella sp. 403]
MSLIVGGQFTLKGVHDRDDYEALTKVLRLGIYVVLSLQLELAVFHDMGIPLVYPPPLLPRPAVKEDPQPSPLASTQAPSPQTPTRKGRVSAGIWNFIAKKTEAILRPLHIPSTPQIPNGPSPGPNSVKEDLLAQPTSSSPLSAHFPGRISMDLVRNFSNQIRLTTSDHEIQDDTITKGTSGTPPPTSQYVFAPILSKISDHASVLSTSPDVQFPPPSLLLRLAEREKICMSSDTSHTSLTWNGHLRLTADEKVGLSSILGWSSSYLKPGTNKTDAVLNGMTGRQAFIKHQSLTVLYAEHVPSTVEPPLQDLVSKKGSEATHSGSMITTEASSNDGTYSPGEPSVITSAESDAGGTDDESRRKPSGANTSTPSPTPMPSAVTLPTPQIQPHTKRCLPAHWKTYQFFSPTSDRSLGEFVIETCSTAEREELCKREGCGRPLKLHGMDWVHASVKIMGKVEDTENAASQDPAYTTDDIAIWSSCKSCGAKTPTARMSDGSFHYSLAKYLELIIYSPSFASLTPTICEHTSKLPDPTPPRDHPTSSAYGQDTTASSNTRLPLFRKYPLPSNRFTIQRHFQYHAFVFTFTLSPIDSDIFEVKVPRIQITKTTAEVKKLESATTEQKVSSSEPSNSDDLDESPMPFSVPPGNAFPLEDNPSSLEHQERDELRLEIVDWWREVKLHLDKLEYFLAGATARIRTKRLPSTPEDSDDDVTPSANPPTNAEASSTPDCPIVQEKSIGSSEELVCNTPSSYNISLPGSDTELPSPAGSASSNVFTLLQRLRLSFRETELALYKRLAETPPDHINDVRRAFWASSQGAKWRLAAWQMKHAPRAIDVADVGEFDSSPGDPEWWAAGYHALPRSRVIVREKDWGSIIAFTLSSEEYKRELQNMIDGGTSASRSSASASEASRPTITSTPSSLSVTSQSSASTSKLSTDTSTVHTTNDAPDPDASDDGFVPLKEEEIFSAVISRKEHPKDTVGILGIRDVLRHQRSVDPTKSAGGSTTGSGAGASATGGVPSRFSSLSNSASKLIRLGMAPLGSATTAEGAQSAPPDAWAQAEIEISLRPAKGELAALEGAERGAITSGERIVEILSQLEQGEGSVRDAIISTMDSPVAHSTLKSSPSKLVKTPSAVEEADEDRFLNGSTPRLKDAVVLHASSSSGAEEGAIPLTDSPQALVKPSFTPSTHSRSGTDDTIAPPVPPKEGSTTEPNHTSPSTPITPQSRVVLPGTKEPSHTMTSTAGSNASNSGSITSTVASAIRYILGANGSSPPRKQHLGLLAMHGSLGSAPLYPLIDERPHLKYDFTLDKRLKFSCTVYYARQFDFLRKRCGIETAGSGSILSENDIVRSLQRCVGWDAEGAYGNWFGTHSFLKTEDDKYIIKTLVNAWNVADLQVLLELAPSYFRYMDTTASHASVLAKLMGFYTIEVQNLDPKSSGKMKADLLVMENLFWGYKIGPGKSFDLKGIASRKVKPAPPATFSPAKDVPTSEDPNIEQTKPKAEKRRNRAITPKPIPPSVQKPLFDGEWIESQQKMMILVEPHSKVILKEAIKGDAEFLAKSNIMDYSLLLGVDQERRQIACGLVDTIGSYTFAKTLEYKAKQGLIGKSGRETTVIPPMEYQDRFVNAIEGYFFACPDKWSKPVSSSTELSDVDDLPSVL